MLQMVPCCSVNPVLCMLDADGSIHLLQAILLDIVLM